MGLASKTDMADSANSVTIGARTPGECDDHWLDEFEACVRGCGEVTGEGLRARINEACALAFAEADGALVGVGALKRPWTSYRDKVFRESGLAGDGGEYGFEVGWLCVRDGWQKRGLGRRLTEACMAIIGLVNTNKNQVKETTFKEI